jgi:hypothetical protein
MFGGKVWGPSNPVACILYFINIQLFKNNAKGIIPT